MEKYTSNIITPKISIAPMVDKSHRHFRYFCRLMNKDILLYTEMVTAQAIINSDLDKILYFREDEGNVALQIAASNPKDAYKAVKLADSYNYSEINLNCGCPSDRVSGNLMGASLMSNKNLVYEILMAMKEATNKPVTIKHRIGIDGTDVIQDNNAKIIMNGYDDLLEFLNTISKAKPDRYTVHARSAILKGLSPKDNREIPPLDYEMVYKLKKDFNYLNIEINGGFKTLKSISKALCIIIEVMRALHGITAQRVKQNFTAFIVADADGVDIIKDPQCLQLFFPGFQIGSFLDKVCLIDDGNGRATAAAEHIDQYHFRFVQSTIRLEQHHGNIHIGNGIAGGLIHPFAQLVAGLVHAWGIQQDILQRAAGDNAGNAGTGRLRL